MLSALKGSQFYFYLLLLKLMLCHVAAPKKYLSTLFIVQIIFSFWSFEISKGILRNQKIIICLDSFSNQRLIYLFPFLIMVVFVSTILLKFAKLYQFSLAPCCQTCRVTEEPVVAETAVGPIPLLINMLTALKDLSFIYIR